MEWPVQVGAAFRRPETGDSFDMERLENLPTEQRNPSTMNLDCLSVEELTRVLHAENFQVAAAVEVALPEITCAIEAITDRMRAGGRLFYVGAGTSGRIGVLDASECPPTFGIEPDRVQGIIAGGDNAIRTSIEGAEDDREIGAADIETRGISGSDVVVGIAASGSTPYVVSALETARSRRAYTIAVVCAQRSEMESVADMTIVAQTGPEALTGSTRLKAGSAQKMILNLLSTGVMVCLGKTYSNLMVDVQATNSKLRDRAIRIVKDVVGVDRGQAQAALERTGWRVKPALVVARLGITPQEAEERLAGAGGSVRKVWSESGMESPQGDVSACGGEHVQSFGSS